MCKLLKKKALCIFPKKICVHFLPIMICAQYIFFYLKFTPCKAEQPLTGMNKGNLFRKNLHIGNLFGKFLPLKGVS